MPQPTGPGSAAANRKPYFVPLDDKRRDVNAGAKATAIAAVRSALKLSYYRLLLSGYAHAGSYAQTVMANGSWTAAHLRSLWRGAVVVVFPPCDTATLQAQP